MVLVDAAKSFASKLEELAKLTEETHEGLVANIDIAAKAPAALVTVETNAPVVALATNEGATGVDGDNSETESIEELSAVAAATKPLPTSDSVKVKPELVTSAQNALRRLSSRARELPY